MFAFTQQAPIESRTANTVPNHNLIHDHEQQWSHICIKYIIQISRCVSYLLEVNTQRDDSDLLLCKYPRVRFVLFILKCRDIRKAMTT